MNALTQQFVEELEDLPEAMQTEALDFVQFLKTKLNKQGLVYSLSDPDSLPVSKNVPNERTLKAMQDTNYETVTLDEFKEMCQ